MRSIELMEMLRPQVRFGSEVNCRCHFCFNTSSRVYGSDPVDLADLGTFSTLMAANFY